MIDLLSKVTPAAQYVCDPVLGDNGRLYVPKGVFLLGMEGPAVRAIRLHLLLGGIFLAYVNYYAFLTELVAVYADEMLPLSNVITPNQFEAELLSGILDVLSLSLYIYIYIYLLTRNP